MGRPKGSKNKKAVEKQAIKQETIVTTQEGEEIQHTKKSNPAAEKWDVFTVEQRKQVLKDMESKGIIRLNLKKSIEDSFKSLEEEEDSRFSCLLYDIQDKVEEFLKKR
jgi:hypothetical protein